MRYVVACCLLCSLLLVSCSAFSRGSAGTSHTPTVVGTSLSSVTPSVTVCHTQGALQDTRCTPGAVFPVTATQVCMKGYAGSVRNVPTSEKFAVYREYGITHHTAGQYEIDHLISLELGGSNDIRNVWPEAALPMPGYHEKDKLENVLHDLVCTGKLSLAMAQTIIATNWLAAYKQYVLHQ